MNANYPSPAQIEVDECLGELREQREERNRILARPTSRFRKRSAGLPVYLPCEVCNGTGRVRVEQHSHRCECGGKGGNCPGGRTWERDCTAPRCFDGDLICYYCHEEGKRPRVENPGVDYIVPILATRMDGDEAVCEAHYPVLEVIYVEVGP